jgi:hypothetical protein
LKVVGNGTDFVDANVEEFGQEGVVIVKVFLTGAFLRLQGHTSKYTYSVVMTLWSAILTQLLSKSLQAAVVKTMFLGPLEMELLESA